LFALRRFRLPGTTAGVGRRSTVNLHALYRSLPKNVLTPASVLRL